MFRAAPNRPKSFSDLFADLFEEDGLGPKDNARVEREIRPDMEWLLMGIRGVAYREDLRELRALADDEESIATELILARVHSLSELKQIRRAFAWRDHPDRLHPTVQGHATKNIIRSPCAVTTSRNPQPSSADRASAPDGGRYSYFSARPSRSITVKLWLRILGAAFAKVTDCTTCFRSRRLYKLPCSFQCAPDPASEGKGRRQEARHPS
jgi:hypothetical protein